MTVTFPNGRSYVYDGVPKRVYEGFLASDDRGRYFNARIRQVYGG